MVKGTSGSSSSSSSSSQNASAKKALKKKPPLSSSSSTKKASMKKAKPSTTGIRRSKKALQATAQKDKQIETLEARVQKLEGQIESIGPKMQQTVDMLQAQIILNMMMVNSLTGSIMRHGKIPLEDKVKHYMDGTFKLPLDWRKDAEK